MPRSEQDDSFHIIEIIAFADTPVLDIKP